MPDRPPDRIEYGEWVPDEATRRPLPVRYVASKTTMFRVLEYEEVREETVRLRRAKRLIWETPQQDILEQIGDGELLEYRTLHLPPLTQGYWDWEYGKTITRRVEDAPNP